MRTSFFVSFFAALFLFTGSAHAATVSLTPSADTYVFNSSGDTNFGTVDSTYVSFGNGPAFGRAYYQFDLSSIPAGSTINSATLSLPLKSISAVVTVQMYMSRPDVAWNETSLTWNNQPAMTNVQTKLFNTQSPSTWDMTDAVKNWVANSWANNGVVIKTSENTGSQYTFGYYTKESGVQTGIPTLAVDYTAPVAQAPSFNVGAVTYTATTNSATFTFTTTLAAAGAIDYGVSNTYGSTAEDAGSLTNHTITVSNLTPGTTYHFRARGVNGAQQALGTDATFVTQTVAVSPFAGKLVKSSDSNAVYYVTNNGKRHAFPNQAIYNTWYADFSMVQTVSVTDLALLSLGANVEYRPGVRLVKFQTLPKTYAIGKNGELRWITSEAVATGLYGASWNTKIDDLSDSFLTDYHFGTDIINALDFSVADVMAQTDTIEKNF